MQARKGATNVQVLGAAIVIAMVGVAAGGYLALQPRTGGGGGATLTVTDAGKTTTVTETVPTYVTISGAQGPGASAEKPVTISLGSGASAPGGMAYDPRNHDLYVTLSNSSSVAVIDTTSNSLVTTIPLDSGSQPIAATYDSSNRMVYVAEANSSKISVIDPSTNTVKSSITAPDTTNDIAADGATNMIYAASNDDDGFFIINGTSGQLSAIVNGDGFPDNDAAVAVDSTTNIVVSANYYGNGRVLTSETGFANGSALWQAAAVPTGAAWPGVVVSIVGPEVGTPSGLAINSNTGRVYEANTAANLVNVLSESGKSLGNVSVPAPQSIAVDPVTNRIFVTSSSTNQVVVIDGGANSVLGTVAVGKGAFGIAIAPADDKIFVSNQADGTVSVIDGSTLGF